MFNSLHRIGCRGRGPASRDWKSETWMISGVPAGDTDLRRTQHARSGGITGLHHFDDSAVRHGRVGHFEHRLMKAYGDTSQMRGGTEPEDTGSAGGEQAPTPSEQSCVDGPRLAREEIVLRQAGCLRSCVRSLCAARMTAGPDGCSRTGTSSNPRV